MTVSEENWKESFTSPSFPLSTKLFMESSCQDFAVLLFCWARFELLSFTSPRGPALLYATRAIPRIRFDLCCFSIIYFKLMSCFKWKMKSEVSLSFWKGNTITLTVPDGCLLRKPDKANASQSVQNVRCKHQIEKDQANTYGYCFSETTNIC